MGPGARPVQHHCLRQYLKGPRLLLVLVVLFIVGPTQTSVTESTDAPSIIMRDSLRLDAELQAETVGGWRRSGLIARGVYEPRLEKPSFGPSILERAGSDGPTAGRADLPPAAGAKNRSNRPEWRRKFLSDSLLFFNRGGSGSVKASPEDPPLHIVFPIKWLL